MKKNFVNKKINKNPNGFSMMEVIMSVFLISTGIIAAVQLISSGLTTSMDSRDQLIATELTQEGLELVRNIRDNNWLNPPKTSFDNVTTGDGCIVDKNYLSGDISCGNNTSQQRLHLAGNFYTHDGATATKFYRKIKIEEIDTNANRLITSMVSWKGQFPEIDADCNLKNKCVYAQTKLTTWGQP